MSDEVLPLDEIVRRYPRQWVLLGDVVGTDEPDVHAGRVLYHGPDREALFAKLAQFRKSPRERFAVAHTGELAGESANWW